jgi:hypothetical protein
MTRELLGRKHAHGRARQYMHMAGLTAVQVAVLDLMLTRGGCIHGSIMHYT